MPKRIVLKTSKVNENELSEHLKLNMGRSFEDSTDDFFGNSEIAIGSDIGSGAIVRMICVDKKHAGWAKILVDNGGAHEVYTLDRGANPFMSTGNDVFKTLLWNGATTIRHRIADKAELFGNPEYAIKGINNVRSVINIQDTYQNASTPVKDFIMKMVGDEVESNKHGISFPKGINENWLRNRFLQTASYLNEVFAFPDDIVREVFLSLYLTKGGSCILSGSPGSGKTKIINLSSLLFMNAYGYANFEYRAPSKDNLTGKIPAYVFKDLHHRGNDTGESNVKTIIPTDAELEDTKNKHWVIIKNIETTDMARIVEEPLPGPGSSAEAEYQEKVNLLMSDYRRGSGLKTDDEEMAPMLMPLEESDEKPVKPKLLGRESLKRQPQLGSVHKQHSAEEAEAERLQEILKNKKIRMAHYEGHTLTQKYSRNRVSNYYTNWEKRRFDDHLLALSDEGLLENEYYTKSLLRKLTIGKDRKDIYVSDVTFDTATYPDTNQFVMWKSEVQREKESMPIIEMTKKLEASKDPAEQKSLRNLIVEKTADLGNCNICMEAGDLKNARHVGSHISWINSLGRGDEHSGSDVTSKATIFGTGKKDFDAEMLKSIEDRYQNLGVQLEKIVTSDILVENIPVSARSADEILDEMWSDIGLTTCSENKTPEEILYTTEISLVSDVDSLGRPVDQYMFRASPLDFVTKPGKFLNEFARADKDFQDQLLSLLDRRLVEHRGERFTSPEFVLFADNNPHKLLTAQIDWALWDRVDIEMFLKGANLGTKDMILTKRFSRKEATKSEEEELLDRIKIAAEALNDEEISEAFVKNGTIEKKSGSQHQGIVPLRVREIHSIWNYVDKVAIPEDVLHLTFILSTALNQVWYVRRPAPINQHGTDTNPIYVSSDMHVVPNDYEPYKLYSTTQFDERPRDTILDFSLLGFSDEYLTPKATAIGNIGSGGVEADYQFPIGISRPVGIRFVISLLKLSKALAWLRRGNTEVTAKEIFDLFPLVGSHRLNLVPFGAERKAGINNKMKELYPNIQDFLKYAIVEAYWYRPMDGSSVPRYQRYLDYYEDLKNTIDSGYLNVDACDPAAARGGTGCPPAISQAALGLSNWQTDVVVLDIMNGVEYAKRNSMDYKRHYNMRIEKINQMANMNYHTKAIDDAKETIWKHDLNCSDAMTTPVKARHYATPMMLFPRDGIELMGRLDSLKNVLDEGTSKKHVLYLTSSDVIRNVAIPLLQELKFQTPSIGGKAVPNYIPLDAENSRKIAESGLARIGNVLRSRELLQMVDHIEDLKALQWDQKKTAFNAMQEFLVDSGHMTAGEWNTLTASDDKAKIRLEIDGMMSDVVDPAHPTEPIKIVLDLGSTPGVATPGMIEVVYTDSQRMIRLVANTFNEHLLWRHIRFKEPYHKRDPITPKSSRLY